MTRHRRNGLDFISAVEVDGRADGLYLFERRADAARFAAAINSAEAGADRASISDEAVNVGAPAEHLIATERGDVLERLGLETLGEEVREGLDLRALSADLSRFMELDGDARRLIAGWVQEDRLT